jgi:predicted small secreted protein
MAKDKFNGDNKMKQFLLALTVMMLPALSACNTMEGMGEDIQKGGQNLEEEANEHK